MAFKVPYQLKDELFIELQNGKYGKKPACGMSWSANKKTAVEIEAYVNKGDKNGVPYNYGVTYSTDLGTMDADDSERLEELHVTDMLAGTYTVKSGRTDSVGKHLYFRLSGDIPEEYQHLRGKKIQLKDPETKKELGDIRLPGANFYDVGPYCIHPDSGKQYLPVDESAEIVRLTYKEFLETLDELGQLPSKPSPIPHMPPRNPDLHANEWDYGYTVRDFLEPLNAHIEGDEIVGEHPIHGSTTGHNFYVKVDGSMWHCFRCDSGGGWMKALAVSRGIIECDEARPDRPLTKDEYRQIFEILKELKPEVYEHNRQEYLKNKHNLRMNGGLGC